MKTTVQATIAELRAKFYERFESIVHVGASEGQEVPYYLSIPELTTLVLVEPLPEAAKILRDKWGNDNRVTIIESALIDIEGHNRVRFYRYTNSVSSSLFEKPDLTMHSVAMRDYIDVHAMRLDDGFRIIDDGWLDLLVVDAQGSERQVFNGAKKTLQRTRYIFTEVSEKPLYYGACTMKEIDELLDKRGFDNIGTFLNDRGTGDALYVNRNVL